jgi:hypothetical protein
VQEIAKIDKKVNQLRACTEVGSREIEVPKANWTRGHAAAAANDSARRGNLGWTLHAANANTAVWKRLQAQDSSTKSTRIA